MYRLKLLQKPNPLLFILLLVIHLDIHLLAPLTINIMSIANLPKRRRPRRPMRIHILIEPRPDNAPLGPHAANLHALAAPPLLTAVTRQ